MFATILSEDELLKMSLLEGVNFVKSHLGIELSEAEEELYNWHVANLEYGCAQVIMMTVSLCANRLDISSLVFLSSTEPVGRLCIQ